MSLTYETIKLTILDVINTVESIARIKRCPLGLMSYTSLCLLRAELNKAYEAMEKAFGGVMIQHLVESTSPSLPLCEGASR